MELYRALSLLKLSSGCTLTKLNTSYRKLAKAHHPDSNRGRESWAHKVMTELNLAYETVRAHLSSSFPDDDLSRSRAHSPSGETSVPRFSQVSKSAINSVLEGIFTYYQYGLENIGLRYEGVRRIRYRDALRYVRDGTNSLDGLRAAAPGGSKRVAVFAEFAGAFFQNMCIERQFHPGGHSGPDMKGEACYRSASAHLDYAIKDGLFRDELVQVRNGTYREHMVMGRKEFMLLLTNYRDCECTREGLLKAYLLQSFARVIEVLNGPNG